jgi:hypothetical protein
MLPIPSWEHDEQGTYREWHITPAGMPYPVKERSNGTLALHIADYDVTISEQYNDYLLHLHGPQESFSYSLTELLELTDADYEEWATLPAWEQALRAAMEVFSLRLCTLMYGHLRVSAA